MSFELLSPSNLARAINTTKNYIVIDENIVSLEKYQDGKSLFTNNLPETNDPLVHVLDLTYQDALHYACCNLLLRIDNQWDIQQYYYDNMFDFLLDFFNLSMKQYNIIKNWCEE